MRPRNVPKMVIRMTTQDKKQMYRIKVGKASEKTTFASKKNKDFVTDAQPCLGGNRLIFQLNNGDVSPENVNKSPEFTAEERLFVIFPWVQKRLDLSRRRLSELTRIPERTLERRRLQGRFEPTEWDRVNRFKELYDAAVDVLETERNAREWLKTPKKVLNGETPLDMAKSESGAREVHDTLMRIEYGVFA